MKKDFKKILQHSLNENMEQYKEDESKTPPDLPDNFFDRIHGQLHSRRFQHIRYRQRLVPILIGILIVTMFVGSLAAVTLIIHSDIRYNNKGIRINVGVGQGEQIEVTEKEAYRRITENFGVDILIPKTKPAGIELKTANVNPRETILHYENSNGRFLDYQISNSEQLSTFFDAKEASQRSVQVKNKEIKTLDVYEIIRDNTNEVWYTGCWAVDNLAYSVDTNLSIDDLLDFVESLN